VQRTRAVQVVLGEGEPGILRLILEAQGFDVVGHARGDDELRRIVAITHPNVIVLDAGISALAVLDAQIRSDYVPIVVVWPKDTYIPAAEERVDPSTAFLELGNVVRRVAERRAEPILIPEADDEELEPIDAPSPPRSEERRPAGRGRHALVVVAAWTIALTALAAIGLAVPRAFRAAEPPGTLHPLRDRPERALTTEREGEGDGSAEDEHGPVCVRPDQARTGPPPAHGDAGGSNGRGCALGHVKHGAPGTRGQGHGRPDDPGKGSGRGDERGGASKGNGPPDGAGDHDGGGGGHGNQDDPSAGHGAGSGSGQGGPHDATAGDGAGTSGAEKGSGKP
jgi:hypothetical protein